MWYIIPKEEADELYHHGIKGQRWGVIRTPEELGHRKSSSEKQKKEMLERLSVKRAIRSREVSLKLKIQDQAKHIKDTKTPGRSYLNCSLEEANQLIQKYAGKGLAVVDKNLNWQHKERITLKKPIGIIVDPITGKETPTKALMIHYSKKGSHIMPRQEDYK